MKKNLFLLITAINLIAVSPVYTQSKVALTDKAGILTGETETMLSERLRADSYELTSMIDTRRRCDYWFVTLSTQDNELFMSVSDCNDKAAGSKNIGSKIVTANDSEKALLLYYAFSEIIKNPYKSTGDLTPESLKEVSEEQSVQDKPLTDPGQHKSRYFFSPSSYNLEKGELYYNTLYFFVHDVQYGISDKFSIGMGTTIMGFPFYLTPKVTIPVNEKSAVAVGDMLIIGTWGTNFSGNLLYATYTRGNSYNNFTIGGGYLYLGDGEITNKTNSPVLNFAALLQISDHIYFITENYTSVVKTKQTANYSYYNNNPPYDYTYYSEQYEQNMFFFYGMAGFRFINRNKDVRSWQFGLSYIFRSYGEIPWVYKGNYWYTNAYNETKFVAFPVIGYARKFSAKY
ncbi:MAG: hypothetical protein IPJ16_06610 [Bacteroidales bacterium]|nr:hypothetical protein [Bacteroidales bacterium]